MQNLRKIFYKWNFIINVLWIQQLGFIPSFFYVHENVVFWLLHSLQSYFSFIWKKYLKAFSMADSISKGCWERVIYFWKKFLMVLSKFCLLFIVGEKRSELHFAIRMLSVVLHENFILYFRALNVCEFLNLEKSPKNWLVIKEALAVK